MSKDSRQIYTLTDAEFRQKQRLPREQGAAWTFWKQVSARLGIDYASILPDYENPKSKKTFTALTLDHSKHWCWPMPLKCKVDPSTVKFEENDMFK